MNEPEFLHTLEERAREQEKIIKTSSPLRIYATVSLWLGRHPWRILIPLAFLISLVLRLLFGPKFFSLILGIFGGL